MKTIFDHIERVQGKPHHIRSRSPFSAAAAGTAIIAFVWLVSSVGAGTFALKDTSFAQSTGKRAGRLPPPATQLQNSSRAWAPLRTLRRERAGVY